MSKRIIDDLSRPEGKLRQRMHDVDMSQQRLGEAIGKSQSWTGSFLLRDAPKSVKQLATENPDALRALAEALDVSVQWLFEVTETHVWLDALLNLVSPGNLPSVAEVHHLPVGEVMVQDFSTDQNAFLRRRMHASNLPLGYDPEQLYHLIVTPVVWFDPVLIGRFEQVRQAWFAVATEPEAGAVVLAYDGRSDRYAVIRWQGHEVTSNNVVTLNGSAHQSLVRCNR